MQIQMGTTVTGWEADWQVSAAELEKRPFIASTNFGGKANC